MLSSCLSRTLSWKDIHSELWLALHRKSGIKQASLVTQEGACRETQLFAASILDRNELVRAAEISYYHYIIHRSLISNHIISPVQQQSLKEKRGEHELSSIDKFNLINKSSLSIVNQSHSDFEDFWQTFHPSKKNALRDQSDETCLLVLNTNWSLYTVADGCLSKSINTHFHWY